MERVPELKGDAKSSAIHGGGVEVSGFQPIGNEFGGQGSGDGDGDGGREKAPETSESETVDIEVARPDGGVVDIGSDPGNTATKPKRSKSSGGRRLG